MKRLIHILLTFSMLAGLYVPVMAQSATYKEFYVSVNGSDANTGTKSSPFKTVEAAQQAVRKVNQDMSGDIIVNIEEGVYYLDENLDFQPEDSGYNGYRVIYRGYGSEKPVISGGKCVTGFQKSDYEDIYVADFDSEDAVLQISVNSKRRYAAKSATYLTGVERPDEMKTDAWYSANPNDFAENIYGYYNPDTDYSCDGFYMSKEDIGQYENADDMFYRIDSYWRTTIIPFEKIEQDPYRNDVWQITMEPGVWNYYASQKFNGGISAGNPEKSIPYAQQPFMVMNAFELLDEPGEFYYNRKTKKLYYMPVDGEDMSSAEVIVPKLNKLVYFDGNDVDDKVKNITFENLQFQDTKYDWSGGMRSEQVPTNSFVEDRVSAVEGRRIDNIIFDGNVFCNIGGTALDFSTASTNCKAVGNVFYDIGDSALAIGNRSNKAANFAPNYPDNTNKFYTQSMDVPAEYKDAAIDLVLDYGTRVYPSNYIGGDGATTIDNSVRFLAVPDTNAYVQLGRKTTVHQTWLDKTYPLSVLRPDNNKALECGVWRDDVSATKGEKPSVMFEFVRPYELSEITLSFKSGLIKDGENADYEVLASNDASFREYDVVHTQNGAAPKEINTYTPQSGKKYRYVMIRKLTLTDLALSRVWIGTYDRKPYIKGQKSDGIEVKNNVMQRIGVDKLAPGIVAYDVSNTKIQHNYIENVSYSGISVGYSWVLAQQSCEYVECSYNWVENCNHTGQDGAGIYVLGPQPGSSYNNNRILNNNIAEKGFYTDNGTRWNTIKNNVIDGVVSVLSPYAKGMDSPGNVIDYKGGYGSTNGVITVDNGIAENWYQDNYSGSQLYAQDAISGQYVFEAPTRAAIGQAVDDISLDTLTNAGLESKYKHLTDVVPQSTTNMYSGFANLYKDAVWEGSGVMGYKQNALMQELEAMYTLGEFGDAEGQYPAEYKAKAQDLYAKTQELDTTKTKRWAMKMKEGREFLLDAERIVRGADKNKAVEEKTSSKIMADDFVFNSSQKEMVKRGRVSTTYPASEYAYMSTVTNGDNDVSVEFAPLTNGQSNSSFTVILGASVADGFEQHSAYPEFNRLELEFSGNSAKLYKVTKGQRSSSADATVSSSGIKWNEINELSYRLSENDSLFSPKVTVVVALNGTEILNKEISAGSFLSATDYGRYMGFYSPERNIRVYDGARTNFSQTTPITNVVGAEEIVTGSVYKDDVLKIEFKDTLDSDTVASGITATNSLVYTLSEDNRTIEIDVSSLKSNQTYTITTNENLKNTDGDAVENGTYTIVTGLITNAPNYEGKVQKLVSTGKSVQRADGTKVGTGADGTSLDILKLTDGNASSANGFGNAVSFPSGDSITMDLGKNYEITMIGASCLADCPWHMSSTDIYVESSAASESSVADMSIVDADIVGGYYIKPYSETGRYVTFDKFTGGSAYLFETFVVAYVSEGDRGVPNFDENTPITNIVGAENIYPGSAYQGDALKIEFKNELNPQTLAEGVKASDSVAITMSEDNKALCIEPNSLSTNKTYTIEVNSNLLKTDGESVEPATYTIKTGLISNAENKAGKVQTLVSKDKLVTRADGIENANGGNNSSTNLLTLTDGYADNKNDFAKTASFSENCSVTIDLGKSYEISMVGASCIADYPWHLSDAEISVDEDAAMATDILVANADIKDGYCIKNYNENGRYVSYKKTAGGAAYLYEIFVVAYESDGSVEEEPEVDPEVDPDAPIDLILDADGTIRDGIEVTCNSTTMKGEYKNILDGNVDTWWFANVLPDSAPTYFVVDLGRMTKISEIEYLPSNSWNANKEGEPNNGDYFRCGFDIQLSKTADFASPNTVASVGYNTSLALGESKKVTLEPEENICRYVRVYMPYGGYIGANDIWVKGFEISDDTMDLIRNQDGSIRDGVEVTCNSTTMKGEYKNILDGNVDTWWFANVLPNSAPTYFIVDLGRMAKIETIEYLPSNSWNANKEGEADNGGYFRNGFDIQLSDTLDFADSKTVVSVDYNTTLALGESKKVELNPEENVCRYIRVYKPYGGYIGANDIWVNGIEVSQEEVEKPDVAPVDPVEVSGKTTIEMEKYASLFTPSNADWQSCIQSSSNANGGYVLGSKDAQLPANKTYIEYEIPINVTKSGYYDTEYITSSALSTANSMLSFEVDGKFIGDSNYSPEANAVGITPLYSVSGVQLYKLTGSTVYLPEGENTVKFTVTQAYQTSNGKLSFMADCLKLIPTEKVNIPTDKKYTFELEDRNQLMAVSNSNASGGKLLFDSWGEKMGKEMKLINVPITISEKGFYKFEMTSTLYASYKTMLSLTLDGDKIISNEDVGTDISENGTYMNSSWPMYLNENTVLLDSGEYILTLSAKSGQEYEGWHLQKFAADYVSIERVDPGDTLTQNENSVVINKSIGKKITADAYAAFYLGGKLIGLHKKEINNENSVIFDIPNVTWKSYDRASVYVWDKLSPQTDEYTYSYLPLNATLFDDDEEEINVVFIGDSLYEGANVDVSRRFSTKVGEWFKQIYADEDTTVNYFNKGVGGTTSDYSLVRLARDVIALEPDVVFFGTTINDESRDTTRNMESVIMTLQAMENAPYIIMTSYPKRDGTSVPSYGEKLAAHYNIPFINAEKAFKDAVAAGKSMDSLYDDGAHPNNEGNDIISNEIIDRLKTGRYLQKPAKPDEKLLDSSGIIDADSFEYISVTDGRLTLSNNWTKTSQYVQTSTIGETIKFSFNGNILAFNYGLHKDAANIEVYVDGKLKFVCDPYYPGHTAYQKVCKGNSVYLDLEDGMHNVEMKIVKSSNSSNTATTQVMRIYDIITGSWK